MFLLPFLDHCYSSVMFSLFFFLTLFLEDFFFVRCISVAHLFDLLLPLVIWCFLLLFLLLFIYFLSSWPTHVVHEGSEIKE